MTDKPLDQISIADETISFDDFLKHCDSQHYEWHVGKPNPMGTQHHAT